MFKVFVLLAIVAAASANPGLLGAPAVVQPGYGAYGGYAGYGGYHGGVVAPAITTQNQNTLRSFGNLGQVSTFSKTIDTPFSSVSKSDVRVSNPGLRIASPAYGYAAPAIAHGYVAPALAHGYAAPAIAAPVVAGGLLGVRYSAAPAVAHMSYTNGLGFNYAW